MRSRGVSRTVGRSTSRKRCSCIRSRGTSRDAGAVRFPRRFLARGFHSLPGSVPDRRALWDAPPVFLTPDGHVPRGGGPTRGGDASRGRGPRIGLGLTGRRRTEAIVPDDGAPGNRAGAVLEGRWAEIAATRVLNPTIGGPRGPGIPTQDGAARGSLGLAIIGLHPLPEQGTLGHRVLELPGVGEFIAGDHEGTPLPGRREGAPARDTVEIAEDVHIGVDAVVKVATPDVAHIHDIPAISAAPGAIAPVTGSVPVAQGGPTEVAITRIPGHPGRAVVDAGHPVPPEARATNPSGHGGG